MAFEFATKVNLIMPDESISIEQFIFSLGIPKNWYYFMGFLFYWKKHTEIQNINTIRKYFTKYYNIRIHKSYFIELKPIDGLEYLIVFECKVFISRNSNCVLQLVTYKHT